MKLFKKASARISILATTLVLAMKSTVMATTNSLDEYEKEIEKSFTTVYDRMYGLFGLIVPIGFGIALLTLILVAIFGSMTLKKKMGVAILITSALFLVFMFLPTVINWIVGLSKEMQA